jgi:hypothetical protein
MVRGARVDLDQAGKALLDLKEVYVRDIRAEELSDEAIACVNTIIRCIEGALGKTAHAVGTRYAPRKGRGPYFPIGRSPDEFADLVEQELPGLTMNHQAIVAAFENVQPYRQGREPLGALKTLYRENHHHDFTLQKRGQSGWSSVLDVGGGLGFAVGSHGIGMGPAMGLRHPPVWQGVPISETTTTREDGSTVHNTIWADWYFVDPPASVMLLLNALHGISRLACESISAAAAL